MGFVGFRCPLGLVVARELLAPVLNHFFFFAAALSTRFGYGRPAFFARALAAAFCDGVSGVDFLFGFFVSQNAFFFMVSPLGILIYAVRYAHSTLQYRVSLVLGLLNGCRWWL